MNEKDKGPAGTDSVTAATEKDVQSDVTTDVERSIGWHLLHPGFPPNKSEFQALEDSLPAPFISLHDVLERSIAANDSDRQEAAGILFTVLGNAGDCPTWYRSTPSTPKSKGKEEPKGSTWGGLLLEHARRTGEPIKFDPAFEYGHDFYETFPAFDAIYAFIRRDGPEIGFQLAEIGPFLTRHGIKGFGDGKVVAEATADGNARSVLADLTQASGDSVPVQRHPAQEAAILARLIDLGFDPKSLPREQPGKRSPIKQAAREALPNYTRDIFTKAWQRLRKAGEIKDATP